MKPRPASRAEARVVRAARVLSDYLHGSKTYWLDTGLRYVVPPYRVRALMNACAALTRARGR